MIGKTVRAGAAPRRRDRADARSEPGTGVTWPWRITWRRMKSPACARRSPACSAFCLIRTPA